MEDIKQDSSSIVPIDLESNSYTKTQLQTIYIYYDE